MTLVAVQCRLSSTRLSQKAILPLGGKTVLDWCLASMKKVEADEYYVATDSESYEQLKPIAENNGFKIFQGSLNDVLDRYCSLIGKTRADIVIRATADNPFLFYEAASALLEQFKRRSETGKCDYITWTGLPHGSGIEIFSAKSLLKARTLTDIPYDHEHVGPSLYNHPENFTSVFLPAPPEWNYPNLRTTIDTSLDYRRACRIVEYVSFGKAKDEPYTCEQIIGSFNNDTIKNPILFIPSVKKGRGTGHLKRCIELAINTKSDIYIPDEADLQEVESILNASYGQGLKNWQITNVLPQKGEYSLIVTDQFETNTKFAYELSKLSNICAIDEGNKDNKWADYLLDVIPSVEDNRYVNLSQPSFISFPQNVRIKQNVSSIDDIQNILICCGGEDPGELVIPCAKAFSSLNKNITAIVNDVEKANESLIEEEKKYIYFMKSVPSLKETLYNYDLVITHYGLTCYEALFAGCAVILLGTTKLHLKLAKKYKFAHLKKSELTPSNAKKILSDTQDLYPSIVQNLKSSKNDLAKYITTLSKGRRFNCPICGENENSSKNQVIARTQKRLFRRCSNCSMLYMAWTIDQENTDYNETYFFDDYKKQYGKTYLEDFESIKAQCVRRMNEVDYIYRQYDRQGVTPTVLDVGCAFGPYLDAANDSGWQVFGTDISKEAIDHVQNVLHYTAVVSKFPVFDSEALFGVKTFDALTMWYVIEHFQELDNVLKAVSKLVKKGGVFAFSTPSASGVSARYNTQSFYTYSPQDHYSLWEPKKAGKILKKYGFKIVKTVITGHHPERFPALQNVSKNTLKYAMYSFMSKMFDLGDTFEVYCVKEKDIYK